MGRGIEAVRRAGTSDNGQAPNSPNLSRDIRFPNDHRRQQRAPPAAPSHHRSAPLRTSSSSSSTGGVESQAAASSAEPAGARLSVRALLPSPDSEQLSVMQP